MAKNGVDLVEFVYNPENLTPEKMQGIIKGIQDWIDTGEYTDKNYDLTHKSIRATLEGWEVKYQLAYHGSPYDFEKFDSSHMWAGAGSQSHGWGHYVTLDKDAAKIYAKGDMKRIYKGKTYEELKKSWLEEDLVASYVMDTLRQGRAEEISEAISKTKSLDDNKQKLIDGLKESDFSKKWSNMYEVDIPDPVRAKTPTGTNYLEKREKVSSKWVDTIVKKLKEWLSKEKIIELDELIENRESWYDHSIEWWRMYDIISKILGSDKEASKFLEELGYDWMHYHWGRDWEVYIIFDDNKLEIKKHFKDGVEIKRK